MANKITIPSEFKLGGRRIIIEFDNEYCAEHKALGLADFTEKVITLCTVNKKKRLKASEINKTYYHELAHMLLDSMGKERLKWDEEFVEKLGMSLYEYDRSKKI
jgi:hypothetical protein